MLERFKKLREADHQAMTWAFWQLQRLLLGSDAASDLAHLERQEKVLDPSEEFPSGQSQVSQQETWLEAIKGLFDGIDH